MPFLASVSACLHNGHAGDTDFDKCGFDGIHFRWLDDSFNLLHISETSMLEMLRRCFDESDAALSGCSLVTFLAVLREVESLDFIARGDTKPDRFVDEKKQHKGPDDRDS